MLVVYHCDMVPLIYVLIVLGYHLYRDTGHVRYCVKRYGLDAFAVGAVISTAFLTGHAGYANITVRTACEIVFGHQLNAASRFPAG